eukprot:jgi/Mesen1/5796/ME000293S04950
MENEEGCLKSSEGAERFESTQLTEEESCALMQRQGDSVESNHQAQKTGPDEEVVPFEHLIGQSGSLQGASEGIAQGSSGKLDAEGQQEQEDTPGISAEHEVVDRHWMKEVKAEGHEGSRAGLESSEGADMRAGGLESLEDADMGHVVDESGHLNQEVIKAEFENDIHEEREAPAPGAFDDINTGDGKDEEQPGEAVQGRKKYEEDVCFVCYDGGELVVCDRRSCPKSYHMDCINRDEKFFEGSERWSCDWHFCEQCRKPAVRQCCMCPRALCRGCFAGSGATWRGLKASKALCDVCLPYLRMLLRGDTVSPDGTLVDFDDEDSFEAFFKDYYVLVKDRLPPLPDFAAEAVAAAAEGGAGGGGGGGRGDSGQVRKRPSKSAAAGAVGRVKRKAGASPGGRARRRRGGQPPKARAKVAEAGDGGSDKGAKEGTLEGGDGDEVAAAAAAVSAGQGMEVESSSNDGESTETEEEREVEEDDDDGGEEEEDDDAEEKEEEKRRHQKGKAPKKGGRGVGGGAAGEGEEEEGRPHISRFEGWASTELLDFLEEQGHSERRKALTQPQLRQTLWSYIRDHKLQNPRRKSIIKCDAAFQKLLGRSSVGQAELFKLLAAHLPAKGSRGGGAAAKGQLARGGGSQKLAFSSPEGKGGRDGGSAASWRPGDPADEEEEEDGEDAWVNPNKALSSPQGGGSKRGGRKKHGGGGFRRPAPSELAAITLKTVDLMYLTRNLLADLLPDPAFDEKVTGAFVRIRTPGTGPEACYRLVRVTGVTSQSADYAEECNNLKRLMKLGILPKLTVGEVEQKALELQPTKVAEWLCEERQRLVNLRDRATVVIGQICDSTHRETIARLKEVESPDFQAAKLAARPEVEADPRMAFDSDDEDDGDNDNTGTAVLHLRPADSTCHSMSFSQTLTSDKWSSAMAVPSVTDDSAGAGRSTQARVALQLMHSASAAASWGAGPGRRGHSWDAGEPQPLSRATSSGWGQDRDGASWQHADTPREGGGELRAEHRQQSMDLGDDDVAAQQQQQQQQQARSVEYTPGGAGSWGGTGLVEPAAASGRQFGVRGSGRPGFEPEPDRYGAGWGGHGGPQVAGSAAADASGGILYAHPAASAPLQSAQAPVHAVALDRQAATWLYKDPQGETQGPFSCDQLAQWADHFPADLTVWRHTESPAHAVLLSALLATPTPPPPPPPAHPGDPYRHWQASEPTAGAGGFPAAARGQPPQPGQGGAIGAPPQLYPGPGPLPAAAPPASWEIPSAHGSYRERSDWGRNRDRDRGVERDGDVDRDRRFGHSDGAQRTPLAAPGAGVGAGAERGGWAAGGYAQPQSPRYTNELRSPGGPTSPGQPHHSHHHHHHPQRQQEWPAHEAPRGSSGTGGRAGEWGRGAHEYDGAERRPSSLRARDYDRERAPVGYRGGAGGGHLEGQRSSSRERERDTYPCRDADVHHRSHSSDRGGGDSGSARYHDARGSGQRHAYESVRGSEARPSTKTPCRYFKSGYCRKGKTCEFGHY